MEFAGRIQMIDCGIDDPDLLTIRAHHAICQADLILYEPAARRTVLEYGLRNCLLPGTLGTTSPEAWTDTITGLGGRFRQMVWLGNLDLWLTDAGLTATRRLRDSGFSTGMIPGVSWFQSATAGAGIPLTRRTSNESFWIPRDRLHLSDAMLAARSSATAVIPLPVDGLRDAIAVFLAIRGDAEPAAIVDGNGRLAVRATLGLVQTLPNLAGPGLLIVGKTVTCTAFEWQPKATYRNATTGH